MLKKLMIRTWRGPLPEWTEQFYAHLAPLQKDGWYFTIFPDWQAVKARAHAIGFEIPQNPDVRKPGNYDPALGELFADIIQGFDFWGHFNLDCVYGRLSHFLPDSFLENIDIYSNDPGTICGPFTIYRNKSEVNSLFRTIVPGQVGWKESFESPVFTGWDEIEFSECVKQEALRGKVRFVSGFLQAHDHMSQEHYEIACKWPASGLSPVYHADEGELVDATTAQEIMMYHFNQSRRWPL